MLAPFMSLGRHLRMLPMVVHQCLRLQGRLRPTKSRAQMVTILVYILHRQDPVPNRFTIGFIHLIPLASAHQDMDTLQTIVHDGKRTIDTRVTRAELHILAHIHPRWAWRGTQCPFIIVPWPTLLDLTPTQVLMLGMKCLIHLDKPSMLGIRPTIHHRQHTAIRTCTRSIRRRTTTQMQLDPLMLMGSTTNLTLKSLRALAKKLSSYMLREAIFRIAIIHPIRSHPKMRILRNNKSIRRQATRD